MTNTWVFLPSLEVWANMDHVCYVDVDMSLDSTGIRYVDGSMHNLESEDIDALKQYFAEMEEKTRG